MCDAGTDNFVIDGGRWTMVTALRRTAHSERHAANGPTCARFVCPFYCPSTMVNRPSSVGYHEGREEHEEKAKNEKGEKVEKRTTINEKRQRWGARKMRAIHPPLSRIHKNFIPDCGALFVVFPQFVVIPPPASRISHPEPYILSRIPHVNQFTQNCRSVVDRSSFFDFPVYRFSLFSTCSVFHS